MNNSKIHIEPFENLKITTITMIVSFEGCITNLPELNLSAPITIIPELKKNKKYYKLGDIPHSKNRIGGIIGCAYGNTFRGLKRSKKNKAFKHCVSMDVNAENKNINMKIYAQKIHIVGPSSVKEGFRAGLAIIKTINYIHYIIEKINTGKITSAEIGKTLLYLRKKLYSPKTEYLKIIDTFKLKNGSLMVVKEDEVLSPIDKNLKFDDAPKTVNSELLQFFLFQMTNFEFTEHYFDHLDEILKIKKIISEPLYIIKSDIIMLNYNFKLNFMIDRQSLNIQIKKYGFYSQFENTSGYAVCIQIPYTKQDLIKVTPEEQEIEDRIRKEKKKKLQSKKNQDIEEKSQNSENISDMLEDYGLNDDDEDEDEDYDNDMIDKKKYENEIIDDTNKITNENEMEEYEEEEYEEEDTIIEEEDEKPLKKIPRITILVYKEGSVTLSGPGGPIMVKAYKIFCNLMNMIRPSIEFVDN